MLRAGLGVALALAMLGCPPARHAVDAPYQSEGERLAPVESPHRFPAKTDLQSIAQSPIPKVEGPPVVDVDRWVFEGDGLADEPPRTERQTPWRDAIADATTHRPEDDRALACVAEQTARFAAAHQGIPNERLLYYISARCGSTAPSVDVSLLSGEADPRLSESKILEQWKPQLKPLHAEFMSGKRTSSWFHRAGARAVLALVSVPTSEMDPPAPPDERGRFVVSGRVLTAREGVKCLVNRGAASVAECQRLRAQPPAFAFACTLDPNDQQAWVEIVARPPKRLFNQIVGRALVHRQGREAIVFPEMLAASNSSEPIATTIIARVNELRASRGLGPLSEAAAQSRNNDAIAAHFFAAVAGGDENLVERIGLGLLAGWDVPIIIGDGGIFGGFYSQERDAERWFAASMERPMARSVMLDPEVRHLAIGVTRDQPRAGLGVLVTAYEPFKAIDPRAEAARVKAALDAQRARRRLAPTTWLPSGELEQAALAIQRGGHPSTALDQAMHAASAQLHSNMWGGYIATSSLDDLPFSSELLTKPGLQVAIRVVPHHIAPSRWGFHLVLIMSAEDRNAPRTADAREPSRLAMAE